MALSPKPIEHTAATPTDLATIDLAAVVESAQALEPLPASVARLAALVADDDADLREIVEVISFDQALTGNLLRRANSAASASRNPIRTVHEAVVRLGTGTVLALAMSASVAKRLGRALPEFGLAEGELWRHSVTSALSADVVRGASKVPLPNELATAALLHDIGKLVLARFLGPRLVELLRVAQEVDGLTAVQAETTLLEVHHGELGGIIAQHWRLPTSIVAAVTYHHSPEQVDDPIAWGARIADLLAHVAQGRTDRDEPEARRVALDRLGIAESRWETMVSTVTARFEELASRYHA